MTRQAKAAAAQRAADATAAGRTPGTTGRPRWQCPTCGSHTRWIDAAKHRHCRQCHPPSAGRGRPRAAAAAGR